jgi:hypothetical protein
MQLIVWDFAGQNQYLDSHMLLMSERVMVVYAFDVSRGSSVTGLKQLKDDAISWIGSLLACIPNVRVVVIGTHEDKKKAANGGASILCDVVNSMSNVMAQFALKSEMTGE